MAETSEEILRAGQDRGAGRGKRGRKEEGRTVGKEEDTIKELGQ